MKQQSMYIALLNILMQLYRQLANRLVELRISTPQFRSNDDVGEGLVNRVHIYINSRPPQKDANIPAMIHANKVEQEARMNPPGAIRRPVPPTPNSLSEALSERHSTDMLNDTAGHKLIQSTMDHMHSSIRHAKSGNTTMARLHAGIMKSALKEAANYVSEDEYRKLVQTLDNEFRDMTRTAS